MSLHHIQETSPGLLHTHAKFEKNPPNGDRVMRKRKHAAHGAPEPDILPYTNTGQGLVLTATVILGSHM